MRTILVLTVLLLVGGAAGAQTLAISDLVIPESDFGAQKAILTVGLSGGPPLNVTVDFFTQDGSATAGKDYLPASGTLIFTETTTQIIVVPILGDLDVENNETFFVLLKNAKGATIADGEGLVTIVNDDQPVDVSIDDATVTEGDSGTVSALFDVRLPQPLDTPLTVNFATRDASARAGEDYRATAGNATLEPGSTVTTIAIDVFGDTRFEDNETFDVVISDADGTIIDDAEGTIIDDDQQPVLAIGSAGVFEGDSGIVRAIFNVTLSGKIETPVSVRYTTRDGTATAASGDYRDLSGVLNFAPGETLKRVQVEIVGDTQVEEDETFFVDLFQASGVEIVDSQGEGTILNDDDQPPALSIGDTKLVEGNDSVTEATFTVELTRGAGEGGVTVDFATRDGSATAGEDYRSTSGTLTFAAGQSSSRITVEVLGDILVEDDEIFFVELTHAVGATIDDESGEGKILNDDDEPPGLAIDDVTLEEGDQGTTLATFAVTLLRPTGAHRGIISVDFATRDGSATAGSDYIAASGTLSFEPGQELRELTIEVLGDTDVEDDETFFVDLSAPVGAEIVDGQGQATLVNDDRALPTLSIDDITVEEGDEGTRSAIFTVELSRATDPDEPPVSLSYETRDGSATTADNDYQPASCTVNLTPGQTRLEVRVQVVGDTRVEDDETFSVVLTEASGATIADGLGEATILNDDEEPPTLTLDDVSIIEGNDGTSSATFTVGLSRATEPDEGMISVDFATRDGSATAADDDYLPASGTVRFEPGQTRAEISVDVVGDTRVEDDETFSVVLSNPIGATLADGRGEATILNDDEETSRIRLIDTPSVAEDAGIVVVSVERFAGATRAARVTLSASAGTATAGEDFVAASRVLSWDAGETGRKTFELEILDDGLEEDDETVALRLSSPVDSLLVDPAELALVIVDDDTPMGLEATGDLEVSAGVDDEVELSVRVMRDDGAPVEGATVTWNVEGDAELLDGERTETDDRGLAIQRLKLGSRPGDVVVTASIEGVDEAVEFTVTVESQLADVVDENRDPGEAAVARALDASCTGATGDFGELCDYLIALDDATDQGAAIAELTPEEIAAQAQVALGSQKTQIDNIGSRLAALRGGGTRQAISQLAIMIRGQPLDLGGIRSAWVSRHDDKALAKRLDAALAAALAGGAMAADEDLVTPSGAPRWGLFVNGRISLGDRPTTLRETGFDFETLGLTAGVDYRLSDRVVIGGALGYLDTDTDLDRDGGQLDARGTTLSAYGSYTRESFYLDGVLSYGRNEYDLIRNIDLPQPFRGQQRFAALGSPDGSQLSASLGLGYDHQIKSLTLGGYGSLSWIDSTIDGYTERDAGPFNLVVAEQDARSLLSEAGLELAYAASRSWGVLRPNLRLSYLHEFEDDARLIRALFAEDVTATEFAVPTEEPDRDYFNLTAGVTATLARGRTVYLIYDTDLDRDDLDIYTFTFGARFELP